MRGRPQIHRFYPPARHRCHHARYHGNGAGLSSAANQATDPRIIHVRIWTESDRSPRCARAERETAGKAIHLGSTVDARAIDAGNGRPAEPLTSFKMPT